MKLKFGKLSLILALFVGLALVSCAPVVGGEEPKPEPDTPIDLSAKAASTAAQVEYYCGENTYTFPYYVAAVIRICQNGEITNDGTPIVSENDNVNLEVLNAGVTETSVSWGDNNTEYKFQGDPTTEAWEYNSTEGYYKFTVNKARFNYGVDSISFFSTTKPGAWGGVGSGIGENAIPAQTYMGVGNKTVDEFATVSLGTTEDSAITWVATNAGNSSITMLGVKNGKTTFDLYLKGSLKTSNIVVDVTGAAAVGDLWALTFIALGKGAAPTIANLSVSGDVDVADGTPDTVTVTLADLGLANTNLDPVTVVVTGGTNSESTDVVLTTDGSGTYTGSFTVGMVGQDANVTNNGDLTVTYTDTDPAEAKTATVAVVIEPTITLDATAYVVDAQVSTVTPTVVDGYGAAATLIASNTTSAATYGPFAIGAFTVATNSQGADLDVEVGESFVVMYNAADVETGATPSDTADGITIPDFTIDGLLDSMWATAPTYLDDGGVADALSQTDIASLMVTNDGTDLYIAVNVVVGTKGGNNGLFILIDADGSVATGNTNFTVDPPFAWGNKNFTLDGIGIDAGIFGNGDESGFAAFTFADSVVAGVDVASDCAVAFDTGAGTDFYFEATIPLSTLGVAASDVIKIIALENDWDGVANNCVSDILIEPTTPLVAGAADVLDTSVSYTIN